MQPIDLILARFEQVSSIPRGTKYEDQIRRWLIDWAVARNYRSKVDAVGNLVIYVPASASFEFAPTFVLQGHLDMVWQETPESDHDFTRDPIQVIRDGDWLKADKTTLGADNGIAIALMLVLVEDETVLHPALELLLTVEEELGVVGADNLDASLLSGKTLVNLDSEEEGVLTVGCAGGGSTYITLPVHWLPVTQDEIIFEIKVGGLKGGHSGEDINKHRQNANKVIARVLDFIQKDVPIRLISLKGGTARNAIPRDAETLFVCSTDKADECRKIFSSIVQVIRDECINTEPDLSIVLSVHEKNLEAAIDYDETEKGIRLLMALPHGVSAMSSEVTGFVETSNNIGIMELKQEGLYIVSNQRSSVLSKLEEMLFRVKSIALLADAQIRETAVFKPWQPNMDSQLLAKCVQVYEAEFGRKPKVQLSHGGLECGIISDRCGGLDTISMGPTIQNPHSPDEKLFIPSLEKIWRFLVKLLASKVAA